MLVDQKTAADIIVLLIAFSPLIIIAFAGSIIAIISALRDR